MKRAVFLDRDGTMVVEQGYLHKVEEVSIFPGTGAALKRLSAAGYLLIVVTNQSGIGRGYYTEKEMHAVNRHIEAELAREGVVFTHTYFSPEAPEQPSRGRKPSPQFLFDARDAFGIDLAQSFMIGDKLIDVQCGWNAGVKRSILVRTGYGAKIEQTNPEALRDAIVMDNLTAAADWILEADENALAR